MRLYGTTVLQKCGATVGCCPPGVEVEQLPNVGREGHAFTHFLATRPWLRRARLLDGSELVRQHAQAGAAQSAGLPAPAHVFFIKASWYLRAAQHGAAADGAIGRSSAVPSSGRALRPAPALSLLMPRPIEAMWRDVRRDGFACGHTLSRPLYVQTDVVSSDASAPAAVLRAPNGGGTASAAVSSRTHTATVDGSQGLLWHLTSQLRRFKLSSHEMAYDSYAPGGRTRVRDARRDGTRTIASDHSSSSSSSSSNNTHRAGIHGGGSGRALYRAVRFASPHRPLSAWMRAVLPPREHRRILAQALLPVCYGGVLAARTSRLLRVPRTVWQRMRASQSRGNNVEEAHYMERLWAPLLTPALGDDETRALVCAAARVQPGERLQAARVEPFGPLRGLLGRCECRHP